MKIKEANMKRVMPLLTNICVLLIHVLPASADAQLAEIQRSVAANEALCARIKLDYSVTIHRAEESAPLAGSGMLRSGRQYSHFQCTWAHDLNSGNLFSRQDLFYSPTELARASFTVTDGKTVLHGDRRTNGEWRMTTTPELQWAIHWSQVSESRWQPDPARGTQRVITGMEWVKLAFRPFEGNHLLSELLIPKHATVREQREQIAGREACVVDVNRPFEPVYHARMWIDRERGIPFRIEYRNSSSDTNTIGSAEATTLYQLPNGGWIPTVAQRKVGRPEATNTNVIRVDTNSVVIGENVPASLFTTDESRFRDGNF